MEAFGINLTPFFEWLLKTTIQASVLIFLIFLIKAVLRQKLLVRWHYYLWLILLVRLALPWSPQSRISIFNLMPQSRSQQKGELVVTSDASDDSIAYSSEGTSDAEQIIAATGEATGPDAEQSESIPESVVTESDRLTSIPVEPTPVVKSGLLDILPLLWLLGALVLAGYISLRNIILWRAIKSERQVTDQDILELLEDCKMQMRIQTVVGVVVTNKVKSPALFGFIRPRLLLPQGLLEELDLDELHYVFLHELAHLRRNDIYLGWVVSLLQILHWFNPLIWFAFRRMRTDQELACDALALSTMSADEPPKYGRTLVNLFERFSQFNYVPSIAGILEDKSQLERRIKMITKFKKDSYQWSPLAIILIVILACVSLPDAMGTKASQLSAKESTPPIVLRRVWSGPDVATEGALSPDGRYISCTDWDTGDLAVYEIATGKKRRLTNKGTWDESDEYAEFSRWSHDSRQIVYDWYNKDDFIELRIVGLDGSEPQILYRNKDVTWAQTYDWSHDGKQILACFSTEDGDQIALVSVADGSVRFLKTVNMDYLHMVFSPDGRYIVYECPQKESCSESDIFLLSVDGSGEIPLVEHPADDRVLDWTPDGKNFLFTSNRTGSLSVWSITITDGMVQGIPKLVKPDIGQGIVSMGFTQDGSFYYASRGGVISDVYTTKLDPETGKVLTPPTKAIQRFEGHNRTPDYSPDGKYMAYVTNRGRQQILCIHSLETGQEREFLSKLRRILDPRWSPDGHSILIAGMDYNINRPGHYQVDPKTGIFTPVVPASKGIASYCHEWSIDGKSFFLGRTSRKDRQTQIILREIESGKEKKIYHARRAPRLERFCLACSPDGKWLAFFINNRNDGTLRIIPSAGGQPRDLYRCEPKKEQFITFRWTPDGKYILSVIREIEQKKRNLWRIPVEGGQPQKINLGIINITDMSVHPDGQHIALGTRENQPSEVWVMENFLPEAPTAKTEPTTTLRKLAYPWGGYASLSPDGRYMCDVDWDVDWETESEKLVLRELATGSVSTLTTSGHPEYAAISPTNTQVAYLSYDPNWVTPSLFTVGLDGSDCQRINHGNCLVPKDWSADGKEILAIEYDKDPKQLVWVSAADGSIRHITSVREGLPGKFDVSPDGRFVAYDHLQAEDTSNRDIFLFDLQENRESVLAQHRANDRFLGWTPDGRSIFFASDRTGTWDAWLQRINNGAPQGFPELIRQNIGDIIPIGFAQGGSFYYQTSDKPVRDVFIAALDLDRGRVLTPPMPVCQTGTSNFPNWSPDGREIAYCTGRFGESKTIHIRDMATGKEREINTDLPVFAYLLWSADGQSILGVTKEESQHSISKIDVQTGKRTILVEGTTVGLERCELLADGKTLLYVRQDPNINTTRLVVRNLTTGREEDLVQVKRRFRLNDFALSPDKLWLAYIIMARGSKVQTLNIVPVKGGEPLELLQFDESEQMWLYSVAWMPDSQDVLFVKWPMDDSGVELWRISAQGGETRKVWTWKRPLIRLCVHPDGQRIAFHTSTTVDEMWVMENFLPKLTEIAQK